MFHADFQELCTYWLAVYEYRYTVLPILIAMRPVIGGEELCSVTTDEIALVRATFTNSSCSYNNVTIGSLLVVLGV